MFRYFHCYLPETWEAQVQSGLVAQQDGIRLVQSKNLPAHRQFNCLAAKGGALYRELMESERPFYIDRLQGGDYIDTYPYDWELLEEYRRLPGDRFWGFQMHEWLSNYASDLRKLEDLTDVSWTVEEVSDHIRKKFRMPHLFLESMTAEEMAEAGRPLDAGQFMKNMTGIYRKRRESHGDLIPCDSAFLAFPFEIGCGAKRFMPEVGAQSPDARLQICYARGMARAHRAEFGVYYEPWGGRPFSTCCYHRDGINEWGIGGAEDFPFSAAGANGGSSRSLQRRVHLYAYLSNASFMSEEWGMCNTFLDWQDFELSEYGQVKLEFLRFARKYDNVGDKVAPVAAVLPKMLPVLEEIHRPDTFCGWPLSREDGQRLAKIKQEVCKIFSAPTEMLGTEKYTLINSDMPDAVDLVNEVDGALDRYRLLVNLTGEDSFSARYSNCCSVEELPALLRKIMPCYVEGGVHWLVNHCLSGGYYLTVFNHSGVERRVESGEKLLREAEKQAEISFGAAAVPHMLEGDAQFSMENGKGYLTLPAGGWAFIRF